MSMRDILAGAVNAAFDVSGDLKDTVFLKEFLGHTQDPATLTTTPNYNTVFLTNKVFFGGYSKHEVDGKTIMATDFKCIIQAADLTRVPTTQDQVQHSSKGVFDVQNVTVPLGDSIYVLQLRR